MHTLPENTPRIEFMKERIICLVLAAGASSRMGGHPKALLSWGETTVMQNLFHQVKEAGVESIVLVTGAHHEQLLPHTKGEGIAVCRNSEWESGIGSSLSRGIRYLETEFPNAEAVLILLTDQPLLTADYLTQMISHYRKFPKKMVVSGYGDSEGVPALFPRKYWAALMEIPPKRGASSFIKSQKPDFQVLFPGQALMDIDTPEAYQKALKLAGITLT